jgi:[ribosomal protein S5]-alanine N-acetyltransferase
MEFILRPWKTDDLDSLIRHADNHKIARFMTDGFPHPYTRESGKAFIEFATRDNPIHIFAIDIAGDAVGGIGIHPQNDIYKKNAELGYWLSEMYWGNGIVTKAIKEITEFAFKTFDIDRIYARPFGTNLASQRVLEKTGFTLESRLEKTLYKNGEKLDELIYAVRKINR